MKKVVLISVIALFAIVVFILFFQNGPEKQNMTTSKKSTNSVQPTQQELNEPKQNSEKLQQEIETVDKSEVSKSSDDEKSENEIYEDALRGVVDEKQLRESMDSVFSRYAQEEVTQESVALRNSVYNRVYSEGAYDSLMEENIQFADVNCKKTLCKLDFNMPEDKENNSDFRIFNVLLGKNILTPEHGAKFQSRTKDNTLSFYISNEIISQD